MSELKGIVRFGDSTITNDIRDNVVAFFDWGLLNKQAYVNVELGDSGVYGGNSSTLRQVSDPYYNNGQVWEGVKTGWVWESGVAGTPAPLVGTDPAVPGVTGVYVNSTFYPVSTTGTYAHSIDHPQGRVVFDTAIPTSSVVQCEHTYKYVNVTYADGLPWFKEVHKRSDRFDTGFSASGEWGQFPRNRVRLPALGVEIIASRKMVGYQLGGGHYVYTDVLLHCVAEDSYTRNSLLDIVMLQREKTLEMFNLNDISDNNAFPLGFDGVPVSGALTYPNLISSYPNGTLFMKEMSLDAIYQLGTVYVATVKCTTEVVVGV